jgi:hypothetical protein
MSKSGITSKYVAVELCVEPTFHKILGEFRDKKLSILTSCRYTLMEGEDNEPNDPKSRHLSIRCRRIRIMMRRSLND